MLINIDNEDLAKKIISNGDGFEVYPCRAYFDEEVDFQISSFLMNHSLNDDEVCELKEELSVFFDDISFDDICLQITDAIYEWYESKKK